jgi:capsular polysaccharide biosynthesis protein
MWQKIFFSQKAPNQFSFKLTKHQPAGSYNKLTHTRAASFKTLSKTNRRLHLSRQAQLHIDNLIQVEEVLSLVAREGHQICPNQQTSSAPTLLLGGNPTKGQTKGQQPNMM